MQLKKLALAFIPILQMGSLILVQTQIMILYLYMIFKVGNSFISRTNQEWLVLILPTTRVDFTLFIFS